MMQSSMGQPQGQGLGQGGGGQQEARVMIDKIKEALMNGITPEELLKSGAPQELVEIAIQELQQEQAAPGNTPMPQQGGSAMGQPQGMPQ